MGNGKGWKIEPNSGSGMCLDCGFVLKEAEASPIILEAHDKACVPGNDKFDAKPKGFNTYNVELRDIFAGQAMQIYLADDSPATRDNIGQMSYKMADAMLEARGR